MNKPIYDTLSDKEKLFADLLERIAVATEKLGRDISDDLERSLR